MISRYAKAFTLSIAVLAVGALIVTVYVLRAGPAHDTPEGPNNLDRIGGIAPSSSAKAVGMSPEQLRSQFQSWAAMQARPATIEDAKRLLPKPTKIPSAAGELTGIFVTKDRSPGQEEATLLYGDVVEGITVLIRFGPKIDYPAQVSEAQQDKAKGYLKADTVPRLVTIHGQQGWANEPGYNLIQGEKQPRSGWVDWQEDGVQYVVSGGRGINADATTLAQLTAIAESFK